MYFSIDHHPIDEMPHPPSRFVRIIVVSFCLLLGFSASSQTDISTRGLRIPGDSIKTLIRVLEVTDMLELLENRGDFTVFAPSDTAFDQLGPGDVDELMKPENKQTLKSLMSYHIVPGKLTASQILRALCRGMGAASFTTIQGEELLASMDGTDIILTDCSGNQARITGADTTARNLVFHRIDRVVLPPVMKSGPLPAETILGSR